MKDSPHPLEHNFKWNIYSFILDSTNISRRFTPFINRTFSLPINPPFRWYKFIEGTTRKQAVVLDDRVKQVSGTLIIKDAIIEDSGKYLCVVNNSVGGESVETVLTVTAPLSATIDPPTQTIDFGRPAVFTCHFSGNPIKTVSWMKDGKSIGHTDAVLRIESVKKEDKGMYQCFIRNDQESAEASAELKLGGRCKYYTVTGSTIHVASPFCSCSPCSRSACHPSSIHRRNSPTWTVRVP